MRRVLIAGLIPLLALATVATVAIVVLGDSGIGSSRPGAGPQAEEARAGEQFCFTTFGRISPETVLTAPIWSIADKDGLHSLIW